jgi:hypothetical protein
VKFNTKPKIRIEMNVANGQKGRLILALANHFSPLDVSSLSKCPSFAKSE